MNTDEIQSLVRQAVTLSQEQGVAYTIVRRDDGLILIPLAMLDPTTDYLIEIIRPVKGVAYKQFSNARGDEMNVPLDQIKKDMIICADDFFNRWGYGPTKNELHILLKSKKHNITPDQLDNNIIYLMECSGLIRKENKRIYVESHAIESITELGSMTHENN